MGIANFNSAVTPDSSATAYSDLYGITPAYQTILNVRGATDYLSDGKSRVFPIVAATPESFNMEFSSEWSAPFAGTSIGGAVEAAAARFGRGVSGSLIDLVQQVRGGATRNKYSSFQVWTGSSPMQFSMELMFSADTNAEDDVRTRQAALMKLTAPYEGPGKMLLPPGPTLLSGGGLSENDKESRRISLQIGRYLRLDDVVIKSVSSDVKMILSQDTQLPMFMTIQISVASFYESFTVQDIDKMFKV